MTRRNKIYFILLALLFVATLTSILLNAFGVFRKHEYPRKYSSFVEESSEEFGVPEYIIYATIKTESGFKADAESKAGAVGLMQIMPATFKWLTDDMLCENLNDSMICDPETNIRYGTYMLYWLYEYFGDWELVYAAYNAGVGNVSSWLRDERYSEDGKLIEIPFSETRAYVSRMKKNVEEYKKIYYQGD